MAPKFVERMKEAVEVPAKQAVTIAIISLVVALTALLVTVTRSVK